jgi:hypothetical protein
MLLGSAAFATISNITPTGLQTVTSFPHTANVSATFSNNPDLCIGQGTNWSLSVLGTDGTTTLRTASGSYIAAGGPPAVCAAGNSKTETLSDVIFPTAGTYTIRATLNSIVGQGTPSDDVSETVTWQQDTVVVVDYPAAPAVAAKLLNDAGVKAKYSGGNYISDVAHEMDPGTDFRTVPKSNVAAYEAAVRAFLVEKGALAPLAP